MSTPEHDVTDETAAPVQDTPPPRPRRRSRKAKTSDPIEAGGWVEAKASASKVLTADSLDPFGSSPDDQDSPTVLYLNEDDRTARRQRRIRTRTGTWLRPLTDRGNAERYMDACDGQLLFVPETGMWREYNGRHWVDSVGERELHRALGRTLRGIYDEIDQCQEAPQKRAVIAWAKKSEMYPQINNAVKLLREECAVSPVDFDQYVDGADTFNVANGTLNLDTFELRPHDPRDLIAMYSPVTYDPAATCPHWEAHVTWAIPDADTRETVQRYLGYCLTSSVKQGQMLCFYGHLGRNGKGVILRAMEKLMGYDRSQRGTDARAYCQTAPTTLLMSGKRNPQAAEPEMARLVGKRFVSISETKRGQAFDGDRLKRLTGEDTISTRLLHRNMFEFTPTAKYLLLTNSKPQVHGDDPAIWRRLLLVNFPRTMSDAEIAAKPDYEQRIHAELPGILNWLLAGLRKYRESGLAVSAEIQRETAVYRQDQDLFGHFLDEYIEPAKAHLLKRSAAYTAYVTWCKDNGESALSGHAFRERLKERIPGLYFPPKAGNPAELYYGGLRLRPGVELDPYAKTGSPKNPLDREDPNPPPADHLAAWIGLERSAALAAGGTSPQDDGPDDDGPDDNGPDDNGPDDDGPDDDGNGGSLFDGPDDAPPPDPAQAPEPTPEETAVLDEHQDEPEPEPVTASSTRQIKPWTIKPCAYVDLAARIGVLDGGGEFSVPGRGKVASVAELLTALPAETRYVHLTGGLPGDGTAADMSTWARPRRLPKGWTLTDREHDTNETRDQMALRYRRPTGEQVTIYRAGIWIGDEAATTSPADLEAATALLVRGIGEVFGAVCSGNYGVPLKSTPAGTGLELVHRTLPRGAEFPMLSPEYQHHIRMVGGQARTENYCATSHIDGGVAVPDVLPGLYVYDMRFCYAALLDLEMPTGPIIHDEVGQFALRPGTRSWEPTLYRVQVTVPEGWDRVGRFRTRDDAGAWVYPSEPGVTFETWAWDKSLWYAQQDGWRLGEHVVILERIRFTGERSKPLSTFGRHLRDLRDAWLPAQDVAEPVRELARIMTRQIAIATIGKLAGTPHHRLRSIPATDDAESPAGAVLSADGTRYEWRESVPDRDHLLHPEWSSLIWATAREWLYRHPSQPDVGLRYVPREHLVAARTDAIWTAVPLPVVDTGKVGHFRPQLEHHEPVATPRSEADLHALRRQLTAGAGE